MSSLREYQNEALAALYKSWTNGKRRIGVSLPTGTGKTHIMAHLGNRDLIALAGSRKSIMYLVHRDTLIDQTTAKLRATLPAGTSIGVVKAERNQTAAQVIVASVHTLRSEKRRAQLPEIGLCVVDEAHVSVSPTYKAVFDHIGAMHERGPRMAGFSATWSRSDTTGLGDVWEEVVYSKTIKWATRNGHLVTPRGIRIGKGVQLDDVKVSRMTGDYSEADLEEVVMLEEIREAVVSGVLRHRGERPGALFAPTVASAEWFRAGLEEAGIRTAGFYGKTGKTERRIADAGIRDGSIQMLTTCTAIAEGYDNPQLALGVLCRPTKHEGLFVQMVGRFLRPWPGKTDALLLDAVGTTDEVKLRNAIDLDVTRETADGREILPPADEPEAKERTVRLRKRGDVEIELFAGTSVQWLTSYGVPFVSCGDKLVFIVEGPNGWNIGQAYSFLDQRGKPQGAWVAEGLAQEDALATASDIAEDLGAHLARRSSRWRSGPPTPKQLDTAVKWGVTVPEDATKGHASDILSTVMYGPVLRQFAAWSDAQKVTV